MMNAHFQVLMHLRKGKSITSLEALQEYGTMRLSSIIHRLRREGYPIETIMIEENNKIFAKYILFKK